MLFAHLITLTKAIPKLWITPATRNKSLLNQFVPRTKELFSILCFHLLHTFASGVMETFCVCIKNISYTFARYKRGRLYVTVISCYCSFYIAATSCVIYHDTWLNIKTEDVKTNPLSLILD